jgi:hypothetical protein
LAITTPPLPNALETSVPITNGASVPSSCADAKPAVIATNIATAADANLNVLLIAIAS